MEIESEAGKILIIIDPNDANDVALTDSMDMYLKGNGLSPKRQYSTAIHGENRIVYSFGHCYIEKHMEKIQSILR